MQTFFPLISPEDLNEIHTRCLEPKLIRNPGLQDLVALMQEINQDPHHPITPSTLERPINISQFPIIISGTVQNSTTHEIQHAGWLVHIYGCVNPTPFKGPHVIKLLANLNPDFPSPLPIQIPVLVSSLSSFRKHACGVIDHLSFDRAAFLYIPPTKNIFRLWTMRCLLDLPVIEPTSCCLHHFIPNAPTYALQHLLQPPSIPKTKTKTKLQLPLHSPPLKRTRSPDSYKTLQFSLERSLLTCLNSYYRNTNNLDTAVDTLVTHTLDTIQSLLLLQQVSAHSERLQRLQKIWQSTQEVYYPESTQTIPHEEIYWISEKDLI